MVVAELFFLALTMKSFLYTALPAKQGKFQQYLSDTMILLSEPCEASPKAFLIDLVIHSIQLKVDTNGHFNHLLTRVHTQRLFR